MSNDVPATQTKAPFLSDTVYDQLKFVAQILLPALGALYFGLAQIWGLPEAEKVVGTITTVDVFLGVFLGYSSKKFNEAEPEWDGVLKIMDRDPSLIHQLEIRTTPEDLAKKSAIILKVQPKHSSGYGPDVFPEDRL